MKMSKVLVITDADTTAYEALAPFASDLPIETYELHTREEVAAIMKARFADKLAFYKECAANHTKAVFHTGYREDFSKRVPRRIGKGLVAKYENWLDSLRDYELRAEYVAWKSVPTSKIGVYGAIYSDESPDAKYSAFVDGDGFSASIPTREGEYVNECTVAEIKWTRDRAAYDQAREYWDNVVAGSPELLAFYKERYGTRFAFALESSKFSTPAVLTPDGEWLDAGLDELSGKARIEAMKAWTRNFAKLVRKCGRQCVAHVVEIEPA